MPSSSPATTAPVVAPEPDAPLAAYLILDDPQRRNALSDSLLDQLADGLNSRGRRPERARDRADLVPREGVLLRRQPRRVLPTPAHDHHRLP